MVANVIGDTIVAVGGDVPKGATLLNMAEIIEASLLVLTEISDNGAITKASGKGTL